jgi:D-glycero-D-manno-heptose 1,7-bisphosphate phosphatase
MPEVVMMVSLPGAGKSSISAGFRGYTVLNRDSVGGTVAQLIPKMVTEILAGRNVVLDNTNNKVEYRWPFIKAVKEAGATIRCFHLDTSAEDCQINALMRMWERYGKIFFDPEELKQVASDPNMFPPVVLFTYKKELEKPHVDEGFESVDRIKFQRRPLPPEFCNKAILLDYDDTLRRTMGGGKYPTKPEEIDILPNRKKVLAKYKAEGYLLLGVSNQSGVGVGGKDQLLTHAQAEACFCATNKMLGHDIEYKYCPHRPGPIMCYCRKPQVGMPLYFILKHKLDPKQCIFVGDQTSDNTCATRVGIPYVDQATFFRP